ncbi:hypothetical protein K474DRAFT_1598271 [Panus rudis PR-1116 ss-1]|nr:hypothetical protein K474DRAFT_1598271 [Panus rudis PR-1116 ss-1]
MSNSFLGDSGILSLSIPGPSRDPNYYISDGNTVLLVENTLFKVHRSTLTKDKSAFETMFQLSSEADSARSESSVTVAQEGDNDGNPIRLQGDTADEFRALLWALYALPHELMLVTTAEANCTQLVNLARITHKYQFRSIETWALNALNAHYSQPGAFDALPSSHPPALPHPHQQAANEIATTPSLVQITELAALCERADLLASAVARWKRQIGEGKDLALAIEIGERYNLRSMLGLALHAMMLQGKSCWDKDPLLTREHRIRLLCGHYSLGKLADSLSSQPPSVAHSPRCTSQQRCTKAWSGLWKAVIEALPQIVPTMPREDVLGKLMLAESMIKAMMEKDIPSQGFLDGMPHCRESAMYATTMRVKEIRDALADYFTDDI